MDKKYLDTITEVRVFFIRNHSISNLALDSLEFKKLLDLQGKS